ncbi:hypothetical protein LA345_38760 (plasmid) [Burkholderia vietnamiensis]|uniref:Uncharacterized protein n=1 Tax=Burkholderia vietnamiensis (strain G4 / LMG 22486) TaxID=269482 RepID=A4JWB5_BURVG|nr:hypothetical protein Bcep1808_7698 [Burkholderia vietnamiensis G4]MCB4349740.1 hypothetical protein [Burkholderia vietnamiensis]
MKVLQLTALDGSKWNIPVEVIARNCADYYAPIDFGGDADAALSGILAQFEKDPSEAAEWASNNMNWSDVKERAVCVSGPEPINMEDSWMEGEKRVVDVPDAPAECGESDATPLRWYQRGALSIANADALKPSLVIRAVAEQPRVLFSIRADGRVELGDDVTPDEAARAFWDNVRLMGARMGIAVGAQDDAAGKVRALEAGNRPLVAETQS